MTSFIIFFVLLCLYFLPTLEAARTKKSNTSAIFILNLLLGWTMIGWVVAAVWASMKDNKN